jgi:hypothetical protein
MVLSLTMISVPSPTEYVLQSLGATWPSHVEIYFRLEVYFHTCDELLHMWAHAEDLDTLEFTLMQVISYIVGPVRVTPSSWRPCVADDEMASLRI